MSLYKATEHGKEHRKPWSLAKEIDSSCRNHGDDPWDRGNRLYQRTREEQKAKSKIREYYDDS